MYFEKWGFMLIFWNMAGVPLSYCHCTIYLANHAPSVYSWSKPALILFYTSYIFVYWVWDTCNSQKNMFRARSRGSALDRKTFPQLPYKEVKNPVTIPTQTGDDLLCDGWYGKARKIHYGCDAYFASMWGLICGFYSPFPWFYASFFVPMIIHRAMRDVHRCREKYGEAWEEYERRVPYLFIPVRAGLPSRSMQSFDMWKLTVSVVCLVAALFCRHSRNSFPTTRLCCAKLANHLLSSAISCGRPTYNTFNQHILWIMAARCTNDGKLQWPKG
jgi:protein-S-isoprenylcysteine O-methyltransferase Ste14